MTKRSVFHSFHFDNDVMRVQQVRNIGVIDGNPLVSLGQWEEIKRSDRAIENWIAENMQRSECVVVLIGAATATRPWVLYEINKAWNDRKGVFGIHIHN